MGRRLIYTLATMAATAVGAGASAAGLLRHQAGSLRRSFDDDKNRRFSTFTEAIAAPRDHDDGDSAALAIMGDSWLCGVDVDPEQAPPTLIGRGLARMLGTTVRVQTTARPSALSDDLHRQVDEVLRSPWLSRQLSDQWSEDRRFAIISIGTGDIIHPIQATIGVPVLNQAINRLQREGRYTVFVLVCPNLGGLPGLRDPLKTSLRRTSRVLAGSQWLAALAARAVPLRSTGSLSGTTRRSLLNDSGRFPSELGYAQLSSTLLSAIAERIEAPVIVDRSLDIPEKGETARRHELVPGAETQSAAESASSADPQPADAQAPVQAAPRGQDSATQDDSAHQVPSPSEARS
ncbi:MULTISPECIES: SGNH/GDSL hydrolase family protein [unclassified Brevibacterium]|uniref:SGNH/GDSL hydrolase family protein n=1 Tax=unclassified Brevibacterium TaxID=2614124 RepID=UPI001F1057D2|nr:SGNH/GDSL hydrolase family protein [Brevibacterium sp. S22]